MSHNKWNHRIARGVAVMLAASLPLSACNGDDDPVGPPDDPQGTMEMAVRDAPPSAGAAGAALAGAEVSGEFRADARVQVFVDGAWEDVSGLTNLTVNTELQAGEELVGSATVDARTFERARIVLTNARADVDAGSQIGLGPIGVDITVSVAGGGEVIIEHTAPVVVGSEAPRRLVLVLNSQAWLDEEAAESQLVSRAEFESAVQIVVQ
jgi:hypothetical protein